jgi:O-antigen/teichoic acid export membrane protein
MRQLLSTSLWSLALRVISILLEFAIVLLLGRSMGPEGLGIYAFYYALVRLVSIPLTAGLPTLSVRVVSQCFAIHKYNLIQGFILRSTQFILLFSALLIMAGVSGILCTGFVPEDKIKVYSLFLVPLMALGNMRGAIMRGFGHIISGQLPEYAIRPGAFAMLLIAVLIFSPCSLDPANAMLFHLVAALAAFLIGLLFFIRLLPKRLRGTKPEYTDQQWLKAILPFSLIAGIQVVNSQATISILGFYGQDADAGLFRLAQQVSLVAAFPITVLSLVLSPHFATANSRGDKTRIQELIQMSTVVTAVFGLLFAAVILFSGKLLIGRAFGTEFQAAFVPLVVLLFGQLCNCLTGALHPMLKMIGEEGVFAWVAGSGALVNICLAMLLTGSLGALGGAIATAVSLAGVSFYLGIYSKYHANIDPFPSTQGVIKLVRRLKQT